MKYTEEHKSFLRDHYPNMTQLVLTEEFNKKFGINQAVKALSSAMKRFQIKSGRTGCFEKGNISWNTGTKGVMQPNSGNFKKGSIPPNIKPIGHERIDRKGFTLIKVKEHNSLTGLPTRFKHKQVHVWEQIFGPVPEGGIVFFRDSDKKNCDPDNLILITRAELVRLNQMDYKNISAELKPSVLALVRMKCKMWGVIKK